MASFKGFADPTLAHDPAVAQQIWLAYSWPHLVIGKDAGGATVTMAAVSTHVAKSTTGGAAWTFVGEPFPAVMAQDPEAPAEPGMFSSETASLTSIGDTWYAARLRYFLQAKTGYNPKYATSWTVHVAAASSPAALANAPDVTLGVSTTAGVYDATPLDTLAGIPIEHCAMLNNPTLFAQSGTLYLITECLAFSGSTLDLPHSTTQVFATTPLGAPATWTWRPVGTLVDATVASELGVDYLQQPDVSLAADGTPIAIVTLAMAQSSMVGGTKGTGCAALELASIDPPMLARDCAGHVVVRTKVLGDGIGACTHDAQSVTGIVPTSQTAPGGPFTIHASGANP